jgi:hypothetical protein
MRVQIDEGANGMAERSEVSPEAIERKYRAPVTPLTRVGKIRRKAWDAALVVLGFGVWMISSEGLRVLLPTLGWKFYRAVPVLYYLPFVRRLDTALIFSLVLVVAVAFTWDKLLRHLLKVEQITGGVKWYRDAETVGMLVLGVGLLIVDACLVYMGVSAMNWGKAKLAPGAVLVTVAYVLTMMFVSWMRVDTQRKLMLAAACVVVCITLGMPGCSLPDENGLGERDTEYVLTILVDTSPSFVPKLTDGRAWKLLEGVLNRYHSDRSGSADDMIVIGRICGDPKAYLWKGSVRDLRDQFSSPAELKAFLMKNAGPRGSRVHESIVVSLRRMMKDPRVKNGSARTALLVLSDMQEASRGAKATEEDVIRAIQEYGSMGGVVGLYFVADDLVEHWEDQLAATGIRHTVTHEDEVNPVLPSFE